MSVFANARLGTRGEKFDNSTPSPCLGWTPQALKSRGRQMSNIVLKGFFWAMLGVAAVYYLPFALGVGWALVGVPLYGVECGDWHGIVKGTVSADSYRIFLTNHGCDLDEEIRKVVKMRFPTSIAQSDEIIAWVKGERAPSNAEDLLKSLSVKGELREFRTIAICGALNREDTKQQPTAPASTGDPANDACYRGQHVYWRDDFVRRFFSFVGSILESHFNHGMTEGLNIGADTVTGLASTGPVMRALLAVVYAGLIALPFGAIIMSLVKRGTASKTQED
jgi:hypothetical protein